jgi:Putative glucoamylase
MWIDFRGIQDDFTREKGIDYFENSRRATYAQQQYAIRNPLGYKGYGEHCWGITASDGPGATCLKIDGIDRCFFDYTARGVPYGPDDGTIAPWAAVASLPFAPEIVLPALQHFNDEYPAVKSDTEESLYRSISGPLVSALVRSMSSNAPAGFCGRVVRKAFSTLISITIWLMMVVLSPIDAYLASRSVWARSRCEKKPGSNADRREISGGRELFVGAESGPAMAARRIH